MLLPPFPLLPLQQVSQCGEGEELWVDSGLGVCYLHTMDTARDQVRLGCELAIIAMAIYYIIKVGL